MMCIRENWKRIGLIALCVCFITSFVYSGEQGESQELKISLSQTPERVRTTIEKQAAGKEILSIEVDVEDGQLVYSVDVKNEGEQAGFSVSSNGKFLGYEDEGQENVAEEQSEEETIDFDRLPAAVKDAAKPYLPDSADIRVQEEKEKGVVYFEIERGESSKSLKFTKDGALVEIEEEMEFSDLPEAVRSKMEKKFSEAHVEKVVCVHSFFYEIAVTKNGSGKEIPISPAGIILKSEKGKKEFKEKDEDGEEDEHGIEDENEGK